VLVLTRQIDRNYCWRLRQCARARYPGVCTVSKPRAHDLILLRTQCMLYKHLINFEYFARGRPQSVRAVTAAALSGELLALAAAWS
jgi:hypothetical protein